MLSAPVPARISSFGEAILMGTHNVHVWFFRQILKTYLHSLLSYRKVPKFSDIQSTDVITQKFKQRGLTAEKCLQKMQME